MNRPLTEKETLFLDELKKKTGKNFEKWIAIMHESKQEKLKDIISFLQKEHELEYKTAHSLTHLYLEQRRANAPSITYTTVGRGGKVIYTQGNISFELDWEFGGGNSIAIIDIPEEKHWEQQTGTDLSDRNTILEIIGKQVVKDQAGGKGSYIIYGNSMSITG